MNPIVEQYFETMKDFGLPQAKIRDDVRQAALDNIQDRYTSEYYGMKDELRQLSLTELFSIAKEMEEGGAR